MTQGDKGNGRRKHEGDVEVKKKRQTPPPEISEKEGNGGRKTIKNQ